MVERTMFLALRTGLPQLAPYLIRGRPDWHRDILAKTDPPEDVIAQNHPL
jgi:hypothetical protein